MMNIGMTDRPSPSVKSSSSTDEGAEGESEERDKGGPEGLLVRTEYTVADFSYNAI